MTHAFSSLVLSVSGAASLSPQGQGEKLAAANLAKASMAVVVAIRESWHFRYAF
jgi:hypothetical protein